MTEFNTEFMNEFIFKICRRQDRQSALDAGYFAGVGIDLTDGFIHFSSAAQLSATAARHFAGQHDLVLLRLPVSDLPDAQAMLKWEPARNGDLFPHLYGGFATDLVDKVWSLPLDGSYHSFPSFANFPGFPEGCD
jgi:uncharacterized protein (DUF952 family)